MNVNLPLKGLATNDAGFGVTVDAAFLSKSKLQALVETSADYFLGDKLLIVDANSGKQAKRPSIYSIRFGPQLFITPALAISATCGPTWHVVRDFRHSLDDGFRFSANTFLGKKRSVAARFYMVTIPNKIHYLGTSVGVRF
ncbi:MAG TPA: hypothetical protein VEZ55_07405 [Chitinophagaceae bacterium]|jgi:hypothetical protein|nr:hypothetical protein [Chitinophagaceae bacterium]